MVLKVSCTVGEPPALFGGQVAAPVRNLDIALQTGGMYEWLRELVAYCNGLGGTSGNIGEGAVGVGRALTLRVFSSVAVGRESSVVWDVDGGELDLGPLLFGGVCRWSVGVELVDNELLLGLTDGGRKGRER